MGWQTARGVSGHKQGGSYLHGGGWTRMTIRPAADDRVQVKLSNIDDDMDYALVLYDPEQGMYFGDMDGSAAAGDPPVCLQYTGFPRRADNGEAKGRFEIYAYYNKTYAGAKTRAGPFLEAFC
jgi:hypothetical protein